MRKIIVGIVLGLFLFTPIGANGAGWNTLTASVEKLEDWGTNMNFWQRFFRVKIEMDSDGTDADEFALSSLLTTSKDKRSYRGSALVTVITDQGTTAPELYTVTFDDDLGADIMSVTTLSVSQAERWPAGSPIIWDLQIDFGDPGDDGDDIVLYLIFAK
jgi:hypothetical protein